MATNPDEEVKPPGVIAKEDSTANTTYDELNSKVEAISLHDKKNAGDDAEGNDGQVAEEDEEDEDDDEGEVDQDEFGVMQMESLCMNCHENVCLISGPSVLTDLTLSQIAGHY